MKKELPPEERLLRLIREGGKQETEAKKEASAEGKVLPKAIKAPAVFALPKKKIPLLKFSNLLLLIVAISLLGYLGFEIFKLTGQEKSNLPITEVRDRPALNRDGSGPILSDEDEKTEEEVKPYSYYSQEIGKKELFKSSVLQQNKEEAPGASLALTIADLTANLTLLGIVLDKEPQAIIEESKTKKSYFLYKGDSIGEIKVEDIQESKVVLSYQGEKIELVP